MNKYKEPTQHIFNDLIKNFAMGDLDAIQKKGEKLVLEYPHSSKLLNILAAVETQRKNTDKAIFRDKESHDLAISFGLLLIVLPS